MSMEGDMVLWKARSRSYTPVFRKSVSTLLALEAQMSFPMGTPISRTAYNKDMQEDKEAIFDAVDTLTLCLTTITPMLETMRTLPANMRRAAAAGFINATDCADYLTKKGMPFRDAYKLTGQMVADCIAAGKVLEELTLAEFQGYSPLFGQDVYQAIDLVNCCEGRTSYGGPSAASVKAQIAQALAALDAWEEEAKA